MMIFTHYYFNMRHAFLYYYEILSDFIVVSSNFFFFKYNEISLMMNECVALIP
jgi:hypothetical protein